MNFASWTFLTVFLPLVVLVFHGVLAKPSARQLFLIAASVAFYAYSGLHNALVLALSVAVNLVLAKTLARSDFTQTTRRRLMWTGVGLNLLALLAFKMAALDSPDSDGFRTEQSILIPLALSYVTFQQIGFIVSCYKRRITFFKTLDYLFFIFFFPQLIMGPIVQFRSIETQLREGTLARVSTSDIAVGLSIFIFGLSKKVLLADPLSPVAGRIFDAAQMGAASSGEIWVGLVMFQLQLFLDFAAYAEMAIGLARMFGIRLPLNFDRPYFAVDRFDLWRRWHISFVVFMRSHVFLPLVRHARLSVPLALAVTGMLSGIWHGLSWTFMLWGLLQTLILLIAHYRRQRNRAIVSAVGIRRAVAIASTFLTSTLIVGLFRAESPAGAWLLYSGLFDLSSLFSLNLQLIGRRGFLLLLAATCVVWVLPDARQFFRRHWNAVDLRSNPAPSPPHWSEPWLNFQLNLFWSFLIALTLFACLTMLGEPNRFIYVQF